MTSRISRAVAVAALVSLAASALLGCGSSPAATEAGRDTTPATLKVFAAASLSKVFPQIATAFQKMHPDAEFVFNFAGTDTLVMQIEQGAEADVFAGASNKYGDELLQRGLIDTPQVFATNRLVVVMPATNPAHIDSLDDLATSGVRLVLGDPTVPVGAYTHEALADLDAIYGAGYSSAVLENVVSNALQVTGVVSSVELGEADAGFVYATDARRAGGKVERLYLPAAAQTVAAYPVATVRDSEAPLAREFVEFVLGPQTGAILKEAGFGPPPP